MEEIRKLTQNHISWFDYSLTNNKQLVNGFLANAKKPFFAGWRTITFAPEAHGLFFGKR